MIAIGGTYLIIADIAALVKGLAVGISNDAKVVERVDRSINSLRNSVGRRFRLVIAM